MVSFFVSGIPAPGGSKNAFQHPHTKRIVVTEAGGKKTATWKAEVKTEAQKRFKSVAFVKVPLTTDCIFYVRRPKSHYNSKGVLKPNAPQYPITKPDATKLWRSTEDALTGIVWDDDARIVSQRAHKRYKDCYIDGEYIDSKEGAFISVLEVDG